MAIGQSILPGGRPQGPPLLDGIQQRQQACIETPVVVPPQAPHAEGRVLATSERRPDDGEIAEEMRDLLRTAEAFEEDRVSSADVKYMKQRAYSTSRSRRGSLRRFKRGE